MIIDRRALYLTAFNLTYQDIERSRGFGIVTQNRTGAGGSQTVRGRRSPASLHGGRQYSCGEPGQRQETAFGLHSRRSEAVADLRP